MDGGVVELNGLRTSEPLSCGSLNSGYIAKLLDGWPIDPLHPSCKAACLHSIALAMSGDLDGNQINHQLTAQMSSMYYMNLIRPVCNTHARLFTNHLTRSSTDGDL